MHYKTKFRNHCKKSRGLLYWSQHQWNLLLPYHSFAAMFHSIPAYSIELSCWDISHISNCLGSWIIRNLWSLALIWSFLQQEWSIYNTLFYHLNVHWCLINKQMYQNAFILHINKTCRQICVWKSFWIQLNVVLMASAALSEDSKTHSVLKYKMLLLKHFCHPDHVDIQTLYV